MFTVYDNDEGKKKIQFEKWKILIACSWVGGCEIYDAPRERANLREDGGEFIDEADQQVDLVQ